VAALITVLSVMNGLESRLPDAACAVLTRARTLNGGGAPSVDWLTRIALQDRRASRAVVHSRYRGHVEPAAVDARVHRSRHRPLASRPKYRPSAMPLREGRLAILTPNSNRLILGRMLAYQLQVALAIR